MMMKNTDALMVEAMRLTRAGRLTEATALIQRNLGGAHVPRGSTANPTSEPRSVDVTFQVLTDPATAIDAPAFGVSAPLAEVRPGIRRRRGGLLGRAGRGVARPPVLAEAVAPFAGKWLDGTHTNVAGTRAYKLYVPSGYQGQALPLIVMLHGCTQDPDDFAAGTGMNFLAEADEFLVAYPAQTASANPSKCWNWFQAADQRRDQGEPALIAGITRQVMAEYRVDASRVYVAGLSAGGAMAAIMAATYPDLYAALGVHSGLAPGSAHDLPSAFQAMQRGAPAQSPRAGRDIPLILFHGDSDPTVHPSNADHLVRHWTGAAVTAPSVAVRRSKKPGGRDSTCSIYSTADRQSLAEHWTVHGAGHAWSGGAGCGSHTDPDGPDASREIVRFFREHPLPELKTPRAR